MTPIASPAGRPLITNHKFMVFEPCFPQQDYLLKDLSKLINKYQDLQEVEVGIAEMSVINKVVSRYVAT